MKVLYKTWGYNSAKGREKQLELEQKTGLKWDFYSTGQGMHFTPIITRETLIDNEKAEMLEPYLTRWGSNFVALASAANMNLADVLIAAKTLVESAKGTARVNRNGNFAAIGK